MTFHTQIIGRDPTSRPVEPRHATGGDRRAAVNPAREINRPELGTLSPGAGADLAVFQIEEGDFGFVDSSHASMRGTQRLRCLLTLRDGEVVWDLNGRAWKEWREAGEYASLDVYGEEQPGPLLRRLLEWSA